MIIQNPLVVIPARGGSRGVPGKNIKCLAGKPLIYYTLEAAREVFTVEQIMVSTDSEEIKTCVENTGMKVPFIRPTELANDTIGTYEVLLHALDYQERLGNTPDVLVLLQPTTPFRKAAHIREAMQLYNQDTEMIVSVKETRSNPYYVLREENAEGWLFKSKEGDFIRRQDCPKVYELNGGIYIIRVSSLKQMPISSFTRVRKYVMDELSSHDIDSLFDWEVAEVIMKCMNDSGSI